LNCLKYADYEYFLDYENIVFDPLSQKATVSLSKRENTIHEISAMLAAGEPIVSSGSGEKHAFVLHKEEGKWKIVSDIYNDYEGINNILNILSKNNKVIFRGFVAHAGHTYNATGKDEVLRIMYEGETILSKLKTRYIEQYPDIIISWGDTPSCSIADSFDAMTSHRPYNMRKSHEDAMSELKRYSGTQFDPHLVEKFTDMLMKENSNKNI